MADTIVNVLSGFYNSVNQDRLYSADDMAKPYDRIVSDGVFATSQGTPSTDFQVTAATGMTINVAAGQAMVDHKWFKNPSVIPLTVPANVTNAARYDAVLIQVDARLSARVGSVVYRTGSSSGLPSYNTVENVTEYMIASVTVPSDASAITQSLITDCRGSSSCPWVAALIQQPDTSALWAQYQQAYAAQYAQYTTDFDSYLSAKQAQWDAFFEQLTEELSLTTNVIALTSSYTTTGNTTTIPIGIASYDSATDVLMVFINGLNAQGKYTVSGSNIVLTNSLPAGNTVSFLCFKSVITGDISTIAGLIQDLEDKIDTYNTDSDWIALTLENSATGSAYVRCVGKTVYIRGSVSNAPAVGTAITTLPVTYSPSYAHDFTSVAKNGTTVVSVLLMNISTSGVLTISAGAGYGSGDSIPVDCSFVLG